MTTTERLSRPTRPGLSVGSLGLGTGVLVMSEFLPAGVLPRLADDLGVSVGFAGTAVAATAVAGALTAPTIAGLLPNADRRRVLGALLLLGAVADVIVAVAPTFGVLLLGRLLLGVALAGFWSFAFGAGVRAAPGRDGLVSTALAGGVSAATLVGVPVAAIVGDQIGWRTAFAGAAVLTLLVAAVVVAALPPVPAAPSAGWPMMRRALARPRLMAGIGCVALVAFGNFAAYPFVRTALAGAGVDDPSALLLVWGLGGLAGNVVAGVLAQRWLRAVAAVAPVVLAAGLCVVAGAGSTWVAALGVALWGLGFNMVPVATQLWVTRAEPELSESAVSLQVTAFQISITLGALLGGALLDTRGVHSVLVLGASAALASGLGFALLGGARGVRAPHAGWDAVLRGEGTAEGRC